MEKQKGRIEIIDALRGISVVLMVIHHMLYNLAAFLGAPWWLFSNPVFNVLQLFFAGLFIALSGVSSRFSRGNVERGAKALLLAVVITYVTVRIGMPIWFGVLHLLGFSMLFFGLTSKFWDLLPRKVAPIAYLALIVSSSLARSHLSPISDSDWIRDILSVLGFRQEGFTSYDYFPLLPWLFVFLLGTWTGLYIRERKLPSWFYSASVPVFPKIGRRALLVYMLHQPVLYGIVMAIASLR